MKLVALMYHDIVPEGRYEISGFQGEAANLYKLTCAEFRKHLEAIGRQPLVPGRVDRMPDNGTVLLTFDDGGASAASFTADILQEFGWPAHFFVTTDRIGEQGFLSVAEIRRLREQGHVVGTHTQSHCRLARCPAATVDREWRESVRRLEDILGERVDSAGVPGGAYDRAVGASAAAAGIRYLFTSEPVTSVGNVDGCLLIGRFCARQGTTAEWISGVLAGRIWPRLTSYAGWNGKKFLKNLGGGMLIDAGRRLRPGSRDMAQR